MDHTTTKQQSDGKWIQKEKKKYASEAIAQRAYDQMNKSGKAPPMNVYKCSVCYCYHLGRMQLQGECRMPSIGDVKEAPKTIEEFTALFGNGHKITRDAPSMQGVNPYIFGGVCAIAGLAWGIIVKGLR